MLHFAYFPQFMKKIHKSLIAKFPFLGERSIPADLTVALILAIVVPLTGLAWNFILYLLKIPKEQVTQLNFFKLAVDVLTINLLIRLKVWHLASVLFATYIAFRVTRFFWAKNSMENNPIWNEQVGNYTVRELFKTLKSENLQVQTRGMEMSGIEPPKDDLFTLFETNAIFLNAGITVDSEIGDRGYVWGILAPKLMSYGLVNQTITRNENLGFVITTTTYQTSELGHKFISAMNRLYTAHSSKN